MTTSIICLVVDVFFSRKFYILFSLLVFFILLLGIPVLEEFLGDWLNMGKSKGKGLMWTVIVLLAVIVVGGLYYIFGAPGQSGTGGGVFGGASDNDVNCVPGYAPTFGATLYNIENVSATETFTATGYLYEKEGDGWAYKESISTTLANDTSLVCGQKYKLSFVSADGSGGDNARLTGTNIGSIDSEGSVEFTMGQSTTLILKGSKHGVLEVRGYDNEAKGYLYNSADASATDFETTGAVFTSTTNNTTAMDESAGVDVTFEVRSTTAETNFNDMGFYILLDNFETNVWEIPAVFVNGVQLSDYTDQLNSDEKKAYSGYEYVYYVPPSTKVLNAPNGIDVRIADTLLDGASASSDLEFEFASIGKYLSTKEPGTVKIGSVQDDASQTAVFTLQAYDIDIT